MNYATAREAAAPCVASAAIDSPHRWREGLVEHADTEVRVMTWVCGRCLIELHSSEVSAYRIALIHLAGART